MKKLDYRDGKGTIHVIGPDGEDKAHFTTWRGDIIDNILSATMCRQCVELGDKITIEIKLRKEEATLMKEAVQLELLF